MRMIVGISGASGVELGYWLLRALKRQPDCETHLVMTQGALRAWELESAVPLAELRGLADFTHSDDNTGASIASGSFLTDGMVVLPCSMKSLAAIVHVYAATLLVRAADVCLKEGRRLVLCPRETPLSTLHLRNMLAASELGCRILPPMLTCYNQPDFSKATLSGQADHLAGKILLQFGLRHESFLPWPGTGHV
jgi:4-hydroxy-3-polyprenylbenzoate decarboxylase